MTQAKTCKLQTIAKSRVGHVQRCIECGCVSIHLGPFTFRLDDHGLEDLWAMLGEALVETRGAIRPTSLGGVA